MVRSLIPNYVRSRVHFLIVDTPVVSELYTRFDGKDGLTRITGATQLVLEGCPRSGNSYALAAFDHANPGVPVASHRHSARAVEVGLRRGLPVIVLVRRPKDAIASGLQYYPDQPAEWAIEVYRRFHRALLPMANQVMIATFEEVTSDFGGVIRRCNARFGTNFVPYEKGPEAEAALRARLDEWARWDFRESDVARVASRPSAERRQADEIVAELSPRLQGEIQELDKLYQALLLHRHADDRRPVTPTQGMPTMPTPICAGD